MSTLELKIPPVLLVVIFAFMMWLVSLITYGAEALRPFSLISTALLVCIGVFFSIAGVVSFRKAETTVNPMTPEASSSLVILGIYQYTRNPMYVGFLFFLMGWGMYLTNLYSLALSIGFILYMNRFQIQPEERALASIFGAEFLAYENRVRRWL